MKRSVILVVAGVLVLPSAFYHGFNSTSSLIFCTFLSGCLFLQELEEIKELITKKADAAQQQNENQ